MGRRYANLCFHFAGSGENLPDIAKSHDTSMDNKEFSSLLQILMNSDEAEQLPVSSHKLPFFSGLPTNYRKATRGSAEESNKVL